MIAAGTAVHLGMGDRSLVIGELALEQIAETGADGSEVHTAMALALCQAGRADEALGHLLEANATFPYALSVRALAFALIGDHQAALADAEAVDLDAGATYLDRVVANVAAAAAERCRGLREPMTQRLDQARDIAEAAGDVVAIAVVASARARWIGDQTDPAATLGPGWRRTLDDLTTFDPTMRDLAGIPWGGVS